MKIYKLFSEHTKEHARVTIFSLTPFFWLYYLTKKTKLLSKKKKCFFKDLRFKPSVNNYLEKSTVVYRKIFNKF